MAALDHPNIVHAYDIDQDEDLHFLVLEYVDGVNLQDLIQKSGMLEVTQACQYIRQVALALQHAHAAGLVHRDIKPANILVDRGDVVKLLDLGLARFFHDEDDVLTKKYDENVLGTADYLSPEQALDSHAADIRADIYSLGATFYFVLTGHAPFESASAAQKLMMHQFHQPKPFSDYRNDVPASVSALVQKMMAKEPSQRFDTPAALAAALAAFTRDSHAPSEAEMPRSSIAVMGQAPKTEGSDTVVTKTDAATAPTLPLPAGAKTDVQAWEPFASDDHKKPQRQGSRMSLALTLEILLVVLPICITSVAGLAFWFSQSPVPAPAPSGPPTLNVSKDAKGANAFRTIQLALREAKIGSIIELRDAIHEESVVIDPQRGRTSVTIQAAAGTTVVWRSKSDPDTPLLKVHQASDFQLKGIGITLDGGVDPKRRTNNLILITGDSPGLVIEDLHLKSFARSAVLVMNAAGISEKPIRLRRLTTTTEMTERPRAAIFFDAIPEMSPAVIEHVEVTAGAFRGIDMKNAIQFGNAKALGAGVTWPGR